MLLNFVYFFLLLLILCFIPCAYYCLSSMRCLVFKKRKNEMPVVVLVATPQKGQNDSPVLCFFLLKAKLLLSNRKF